MRDAVVFLPMIPMPTTIISHRLEQKHRATAIKSALVLRLSLRLVLYYVSLDRKLPFLLESKDLMEDLVLRQRKHTVMPDTIPVVTCLLPYLADAVSHFVVQTHEMQRALCFSYCTSFLQELFRFQAYLAEMRASTDVPEERKHRPFRHFVTYLLAYHQIDDTMHKYQMAQLMQLCAFYPSIVSRCFPDATTCPRIWYEMDKQLEHDLWTEHMFRRKNYEFFCVKHTINTPNAQRISCPAKKETKKKRPDFFLRKKTPETVMLR